jgi:Xaa-Pro aminopeptidase
LGRDETRGSKEYEMADLFLKTVNDDSGYQGLAFPTIMASGIHGTCLHYPTPLDTIKERRFAFDGSRRPLLTIAPM